MSDAILPVPVRIAVRSIHGGTGKTLLCLSMAHLLLHCGKNVLLVDFSGKKSRLAEIYDREKQYFKTTENVSSTQLNMASQSNFSLLYPSGYSNPGVIRNQIKHIIRSFSNNYDAIIVDFASDIEIQWLAESENELLFTRTLIVERHDHITTMQQYRDHHIYSDSRNTTVGQNIDCCHLAPLCEGSLKGASFEIPYIDTNHWKLSFLNPCLADMAFSVWYRTLFDILYKWEIVQKEDAEKSLRNIWNKRDFGAAHTKKKQFQTAIAHIQCARNFSYASLGICLALGMTNVFLIFHFSNFSLSLLLAFVIIPIICIIAILLLLRRLKRHTQEDINNILATQRETREA